MEDLIVDPVEGWMRARRERVRDSQKQPAQDFNLGVCIPDNLMTHQRLFTWSYAQAREQFRIPYIEHRPDASDLPLTRNAAIEKAFENDLTHLIMLDADMVIPPGALKRLAFWAIQGYDLVSATAFKRKPPHRWIAQQYDAETGMYAPWPIEDLLGAGTGLFPVDAFGMACTIMSMRMVAKLGPAPFDRAVNEVAGGYYGEDYSFCRRAKAEGFQPHIDTGLCVGHIIEGYIGPEGLVYISENPWIEVGAVKTLIEEGKIETLKRIVRAKEKNDDGSSEDEKAE